MTKIKEITYPITVYGVGEFYPDNGELTVKTFDGPPTNYDSHQIRDGKFIWTVDLNDNEVSYYFHLEKKEAKKIAAKVTKDRIKHYQNKLIELKKQLKDIRAL